MAAKKIYRPCIAFKMNYCDGGKDSEHVGFYGICSDKIIEYNIKHHRAWCSDEDCACKQYYDKKISRDELEENWEDILDGAFTCYESAALRDWVFSAGYDDYHGGRVIRGAKEGHLCVLTTVAPNMKEEDRFIVAMFIIGRLFEGDEDEAGFVGSYENLEYALEFMPNEVHKMKFWKVYHNSNGSIKWGSGLFRYFSDDDAVKFLKMAVEVKRGTDDEKVAKNFLKHYCELNNLSS